jgi:hypothetical protein
MTVADSTFARLPLRVVGGGSRRASFLFVLCVAIGCDADAVSDSDAVRARAGKGSRVITVSVWPTEIRVGDPVRIEIGVDTPGDFEVEFPDASAFGDVAVRASGDATVRPTEQGLSWRRTYEFRPHRSGVIRVPPLSVACRPTGAAASDKTTLTSNPLKIAVVSMLAPTDAPTRPRGVTAPLAVSTSPLSAWHVALLAAAIAALIVAWRVLARRESNVEAVSPEDRAVAAIGRLAPAEWLGRGEEREFYYRLSDIVRAYIEQQFALPATLMTTNEFFRRLSRTPDAVPGGTTRLRAFLAACDDVKYAALRLGAERAEAAKASAVEFVQLTAAAKRGAEERAA